MSGKIQKIINQMIDLQKDQFNDLYYKFSMNYLSKKEFIESLLNYTFRCKFYIWANSKNELDVIPYLDPYAIMGKLNEINASVKDIVNFIEWYFDGFVSFYGNFENKKTFVQERIHLFTIVEQNLRKFFIQENKMSMKDFSENTKNFLECLYFFNSKETSDKIGNIFDQTSLLSFEMLAIKNNGISYQEQYDYLREFGIKEELLNKIKDENENRKKQQKNEEKLSIATKEEILPVSKKTTNNLSLKTDSEKRDNEKRKKLFEELKKYYIREKRENTQIIEGETFNEVMHLLKELFSTQEVSEIKSILLENNKRMKIEKIKKAQEELLTDENFLFLNFISKVSSQNYIHYLAYQTLIQKTLVEIQFLLKEYLNLNELDQEAYKIDYQEQMNSILGDLKEYGLQIPSDFESSEARK